MSIDLKQARESAGYTIEYVASRLNIRKQYLLDLESGNYSSIPGQIYVDGYKKMYYSFLDIAKPELKTEDDLSVEVEKDGVLDHSNKLFFASACILLLLLIGSFYHFIKVY
jgi:cytoskeletal protein RodZ